MLLHSELLFLFYGSLKLNLLSKELSAVLKSPSKNGEDKSGFFFLFHSKGEDKLVRKLQQIIRIKTEEKKL